MARDPRRLSASEEQFGAWVQEAIADLPPPYDKIVRDVSVVVEDEPPLDVLEELELESGRSLGTLPRSVASRAIVFSARRRAASPYCHLQGPHPSALANKNRSHSRNSRHSSP